jgi:hypothetical protein
MKPDPFDIVAFVGLGLLLWGVARMNISASLIVAGIIFVYFGFVMSGKWKSGR